jgi:hypothetical protein
VEREDSTIPLKKKLFEMFWRAANLDKISNRLRLSQAKDRSYLLALS